MLAVKVVRIACGLDDQVNGCGLWLCCRAACTAMARCSIAICGAGLFGFLLLYAAACIILFPFLVFPPQLSPLSASSSDAILADFFGKSSCHEATQQQEHCDNNRRSGFFFGLATAPAHVEDQLEDAWLEFARTSASRRPVKAWHTVPLPEERLRFWSEPEVEMGLAKEGGATVFRLGVDWGRIVPVEPLNGTRRSANAKAVQRYQYIMQRARSQGMRVMLTLFHHSMPKWALSYGGWADRRTVAYFVEFAAFSREHFGHLVDYWITFNEPHIFVLLSHCSGTWPPGKKPSTIKSLACFSPFGDFGKAMGAVIEAHISAYKALHESAPVGVAHHVGIIRPYGLLDAPLVLFARWLTQFQWIDRIRNHLDFCGLNYYGQEVLSAAGLMLAKDEEYSEAGRGVYPDGLYELLLAFHKRYKDRRPPLRYIITENGMADDRDILRRPYLIEHLLALNAARGQGVPVDGYLHWTITDNWEWADGYCPKFGLVYADRSHNLTRYPRPSYYLYKKIAESGIITGGQRHDEWETLQRDMRGGGIRPFCRAADGFGRMWADSLDQPTMRPISERDWRFGEYKTHGLLTYASRSVEVAKMLLSDATRLLFSGYGEVTDLRAGEL